MLAAAVFVMLLVACSGGSDLESTEAAVPAEDQGADVAEGSEGGAEESGVVGYSDERDVVTAVQDGDAATADDATAPQPPAGEPLPDSPPVDTGDRIIKEGTISIEVETDTFDQSFSRVIAAARRYGGDVVGSSTSTNDDGDTFGSVTVRVPVDNFEDLVVGVGDVGEVRDRDISSQDVSAEYTDLESRLRHLRAQERFYLQLLERAESVNDAIAVQQQLDGIQSQIEQIQGRLNLLEDKTSFSTLTVELYEPGTGSALATQDDPEARPSLARYWDTARDAFVNVIGALLVGVLFALPLLIIAGALLVGWRFLRPAPMRRPTHAPAEREREDVQS
jgi:hypothetical protein